MSQYLFFYIRTPDDKFVCLGDHSSSSDIFRYARIKAWEKIIPISEEWISDRVGTIDADIERCRKKIVELEKKKFLVGSFENTVDEKMEGIKTIENEISEIQEEIDFITIARDYFVFLGWIIDIAPTGTDSDNYIYAGLEVYPATIDKISKDDE